MRSCKFVRDCDVVPLKQSLLPAITERIKKDYDWIIITEDDTLAEILNSDLSVEDKLKLLPVQKKENFSHIYSKIGLSKVFSAHGVDTPPFFIAQSLAEALVGANQLGYPVFLKVDSSGGGAEVYECKTPSDLTFIKPQVFDKPVLIQKKYRG